VHQANLDPPKTNTIRPSTQFKSNIVVNIFLTIIWWPVNSPGVINSEDKNIYFYKDNVQYILFSNRKRNKTFISLSSATSSYEVVQEFVGNTLALIMLERIYIVQVVIKH
jgi:hypothetical protein